jgi:hypothetical protein
MNPTTYQIQGITCGKCVATVEGLLAGTKYTLHKTDTATEALAEELPKPPAEASTLQATWLLTYKPLLILIGLILACSVLVQIPSGHIHPMETMRYFMAGFFLSFAFFKLLDIPAFANVYAGYDLLAAKWQAWGYVYPFVELGLGMAYLANWQPALTYWVTLVVMGFSAMGVILAVMSKRRIQCACLGAVFKLPMSTVTIVEDLGMVLMAGVMLWLV